MPRPKEISTTSTAAADTRQTRRELLVKRLEFDKPRRKYFLYRRPEVLDIKAELSNVELTQEWDVLGGGGGPAASPAEPEAEVGVGQTARRAPGTRTTHNPLPRRDYHGQVDDDEPGPSKRAGSTLLQEEVEQATTRSTKRRESSVEKRGASVQMHPISSSEHLAADGMDASSSSSVETQRRSRQLLVGWDTFRSRTMLLLIVLLVVWAIVYFPIILT
ncbi:uncharacterized protein LOC124405479 [Diprion similis]|uniref:uncharacterized protein LOC124405479 n=1 Tax=Diprion similis TaxID=362088 RepID=UPI001EF834A7|nr:uncharacterized protein LOC124405479 [Diprion similis]